MDTRIYAAYQGDDYVMVGTLDEIAARLHRKKSYPQWTKAPAGRKQAEKSLKMKKPSKRIVLVLLGEEDYE